MNSSKVLLFLITISTLLIFSNSTLSAEITEPIRDGDYIYIDDSKTFLKSTYSATHGEDIEHWAMTKQFTGDCDMAIGFDGRVAWPTKVLLDDPHYEYSETNESYTFHHISNFAQTTDSQDYGNWYNLLKYKFDHKIHVGYENATNESIWQDVIGTVVYFDSQENDGTNYTITWHTEHSRLEQYRDISDRILANPINYEFDGKNLWFVTKDIPMTANEMRKIVIEMDGKMEWGAGNSYKYDILWKPSHQSINEALVTGNLYVLDPLWNSSYDIRLKMSINNTAGAGVQTDFQVSTNISAYSANASSLRCYNRTTGNIIAHWNETVVGGNVEEIWTNNSIIASGWDNNTFCAWQTTPTASSSSDGDATFLQYHGSASSNFLDSVAAPYENISIHIKWKRGATTNTWWGLGTHLSDGGGDQLIFKTTTTNNGWYYWKRNDGGTPDIEYGDPGWDTNWHISRVNYISDVATLYIDGVHKGTSLSNDAYKPNENMGLGMFSAAGTAEQDWSFVKKCVANEPVYESPEVEYYIPSLYYNTTPVLNAIYSSPHEYALNLTPTGKTNTNDTTKSTGLLEIVITNYDNSASIVRNFTLTGDDLDWYQAANLSGSYSMKNSTGTVQTVNDGNFTINLVAGNYWIESEGITITRTSQTPTYLYENTTGNFQVIWDVEHNAVGLDHSRIYHMWNQYDYGIDCYCNSIRFPSNNKAANFTPTGEFILRQDNRNGTALFENDTRVTEGTIGKWGGLDKNSARMNIVEINSFNTRIYINGTVQDMVFPNSWPLNRIELEDATKTAYSIYINHPIIIKWYDIEAAKGNTNYIVSPYFDTELNGLTPTFPIEIYYHNGSFDPLGAVNIEDSPDLVYVTSTTGLDWINWTYSPRANADYINGVYLNSSSIVNAGVTPDKDSFWYLKSQTSQIRAYDIMLANSATSTNRSFAQTDSVWIGNTAPYTAHPYTASSFTSFSRGEHQINYRLFVIDNNSVNATSANFTSNISASIFPPTNPTINHFHYQNETDYNMDGIYSGNFSIGCGVATDPDGGTVTHNLTLHYANNLSLVFIINNTFTDLDITHNGIYFDANFSSIPYYSDTLQYTLKIVAIDDEGYTSESWLGRNFTLTPTVNISGYITNILELPIENARIDINSNYVFTNSSGYYEIFEIIPGLNNITIRAIGYNNKYDRINMINTSISNYTLKERRCPSKAPCFGFILSLIIILTVAFTTRKPKQF